MCIKDLFINNYNFKINVTGSGEKIIFVHGSVSDFRTWTVIERELS
jgi:hypothetical protein